MIILGLKTFGHDTGAAIVADDGNELKVVAISEARLNRNKHSWRYPLLSINYCLKSIGLTSLSDVNHIFCDWHIGQVSGNLSTKSTLDGYVGFDTLPALNQSFHAFLGGGNLPINYCGHLEAHAASTYFMSPFDEAAVLVIDGGMGIFRGEGNKLTKIDMNGYGESYFNGKKINIPNYPGTGSLFHNVTSSFGFSNFDAGKTMALAAYAGDFDNTQIFPVGADRHKDSLLNYRATIIWLKENICRDKNIVGEVGPLSKYWVNLARQAQNILEEDVIYLAEQARRKARSANLTYAGGVALSCIANRKLFDRSIFDDIFIQPASSDEGIPLGCALYGYYARGGQKRKIMESACLGKRYSEAELNLALKADGIKSKTSCHSEVAKLIAGGKIIARVQGRSEYGPRALGHRSILADPRRENISDELNVRVKHRERFRPFAPSVPFGWQDKYFKMPMPGPYMNIAAIVRPEYQKIIPAVTHVDGSCRPQTVNKEYDKDYFDLLTAFGNETNIYCLVNTSFNDSGEPIVENYSDAISSFLNMEIDYLYIENKLVSKYGFRRKVDKKLSSSAYLNQSYWELAKKLIDIGSVYQVLKPLILDNGIDGISASVQSGLLPPEK